METDYKQLKIGFKPQPNKDKVVIFDGESDMHEQNANNMCPIVAPVPEKFNDETYKKVHKVLAMLRFFTKAVRELPSADMPDFNFDVYMHMAAPVDNLKNIFTNLAEKHGETNFKTALDQIDNIQSN